MTGAGDRPPTFVDARQDPMPMADELPADAELVRRIRAGDADAWSELIERFEGRLLAFVESRLRRRDASEDVVQETLLGFLHSLPNYDGRRPLETYLFSIAAHKLTDHLRREGRRPAVRLEYSDSDGASQPALVDPARPASSLVRSEERHALEEQALVRLLRQQIDAWRSQGDWHKLRCAELLFLRGSPNKQVARELDWTEQQVANFKSEFLQRLREQLRRGRLNADVFPELYSP
jgi:RNA polymerase sigma-70 factor (ECF subfamily)